MQIYTIRIHKYELLLLRFFVIYMSLHYIYIYTYACNSKSDNQSWLLIDLFNIHIYEQLDEVSFWSRELSIYIHIYITKRNNLDRPHR